MPWCCRVRRKNPQLPRPLNSRRMETKKPNVKSMYTQEFFQRWYAAFAPAVDSETMQKYVTAEGCCPWHIFTHGGVECLSGDDAFAAYKKIAAGDVYCYVGREYSGGRCKLRANNFAEITASRQTGDEIYITAPDFSWTFVWTHEEAFGPYFIKK